MSADIIDFEVDIKVRIGVVGLRQGERGYNRF